MTTKAETELTEAFQRLITEIGRLDADRARDMRTRMTLHLNTMAAVAVSKAPKCGSHPTEPAHSCRVCRSEEIVRPKPLPETPEDARKIDARILGENEESEQP